MPPPTLQTCRHIMESLGEVKLYLPWYADNSMHIAANYWTRTGFTILMYEDKTVLDKLNHLNTFVRCDTYGRYIDKQSSFWWDAYFPCWGNGFATNYDLLYKFSYFVFRRIIHCDCPCLDTSSYISSHNNETTTSKPEWFYFVWRRHSKISPYTGSRVNSNYASKPSIAFWYSHKFASVTD